jgi:hypothetical protein
MQYFLHGVRQPSYHRKQDMEANAPITDLINEFAWRGDSGQAARSPSFSSRLEPSKRRDSAWLAGTRSIPGSPDRPGPDYGTPDGVAASDTPPIWLKADQVVRIEIEKLGFLENRVIDEPVSRTTYIV